MQDEDKNETLCYKEGALGIFLYVSLLKKRDNRFGVS